MWAELPFALPRDLFGRPRLAERAMRADQCVVQPIHEDLALVVRARTVYRVTSGGPLALGRIRGDCPLRSSIAVLDDGSCVFGEYFLNPERLPVRVWRVTSGLANLEQAHVFPAGSIRHVHSIQTDPFAAGKLWLTTGDRDGECYFWCSDQRLQQLERIGSGTQRFRAVNLFFTEGELLWFTDSEREQNFLMSMDRKTGLATQHRPVESSVWYGRRTIDGVYLAATTVESGPGVLTREATVYASRNGFDWSPVRRFRKDPWRPMKLFKYGVISFANGAVSSDRLWINGEGLWNLDGMSAECSLH